MACLLIVSPTSSKHSWHTFIVNFFVLEIWGCGWFNGCHSKSVYAAFNANFNQELMTPIWTFTLGFSALGCSVF